MKYVLSVLVALMILTCAMPVQAADITGKWTAEMPSRNGQTRTTTFDFKVDGSTLTGTVAGGRGEPAQIKEGKIDGDSISFVVIRTFQDQEMKMQYKGKVNGDQINFTMQVGDREPREFVAKKAS